MATGRRYLVGLWIVAALCQVAGDVMLYLGARDGLDRFSWLGVRVSEPVPDSLDHIVARYLRDSIGITTERHEDTVLVAIPPAARKAIDARVAAVRAAGHESVTSLAVGLGLLHVPILLAFGVTIAAVSRRAAAERNHALDDWGTPAGEEPAKRWRR